MPPFPGGSNFYKPWKLAQIGPLIPHTPHHTQGKAGNVVQYLTRTKAIRKLQLKLSEFRYDGL